MQDKTTRRYERKFWEKDSLNSIKTDNTLDNLVKFLDNESASRTAINLLESVNYPMMERACRYLRIEWTCGDGKGNTWQQSPSKSDFQHVLCQGMQEIWKSYQNFKENNVYDIDAILTFSASLNNMDLNLSANESADYYQWNMKFNIEDITKFCSAVPSNSSTKERIIS